MSVNVRTVAGLAGSQGLLSRRRRAVLLAGASMVALLATGPLANARDLTPSRGGSSTSVSSGAAPQTATAAQAAQAARRGRETLARTTQAMQAMRAAQAAARAAAQAIPSTVPNGLGVGGLKPVENPNSTNNGLTVWVGADDPTQKTTTDSKGNTHYDVTIKQTDGRAILSWETFNIGRETTLTFNQPGADAVVLNRVVGQLDATTGRRDPSKAPAPSVIQGAIKAEGTVLVLNANGVLFSGTSQVNVRSLVATSLEVGRAFDVGVSTPRTIAQRNAEFLSSGLLGFNDTSVQPGATFSAQRITVDSVSQNEPLVEGQVTVAAGATITAAKDGLILLTGPKVENSGHLVAHDGQVVLQSGREILVRRSEGKSTSVDPDIRGIVATSVRNLGDPDDYVINTSGGLIEANRGNITLGGFAAVINEGMLSSTTSVSRNGSIVLSAADIKVAPGAILSIGADAGTDVIPQDAESIAAFKPSSIVIGNRNNLGGAAGIDQSARIEIGRDTLIRAPGADVEIGTQGGAGGASDQQGQGQSRVFLDTGAVIDVSGLKDVLVPTSRNVLTIGPLKGNELANSPLYRNGFLNGATVYVDPRLSGVRADGVAWIGSPLLDAASYYAQVGVNVSELMTGGGSVSLGAQGYAGTGDAALAPDVIVRAGAVVDISGGWVRYEGGSVQTTKLVTTEGQVVDIGNADPNIAYAGIYKGFSRGNGRWDVVNTWTNPLVVGARPVAEYTEGRDAGALTVKASAIAFDGTIFGDAFAGDRQIRGATVGTAASDVFGDARHLQASGNQLPSGGFFYVQALTETTGGANVAIVGQGQATEASAGLAYGGSVSIGADGTLVRPDRPASSRLSAGDRETIVLSDGLLSDSGLSQVSVHTSGSVTVESSADVTLAAGGVFDVLAGRTLTVDGDITVAGGRIALETFDSRGLSNHVYGGSAFGNASVGDKLGDYDIVVNGTLSTRGRWVNDRGRFLDGGEGAAFLDGGSISLYAAPNLAAVFDAAGNRLPIQAWADPEDPNAPRRAQDISGSVLVNAGATLDVSGGGRVRPDGTFDFLAHGGDLALISETTYFQLGESPSGRPGGLSGFRVGGLVFSDSSANEVPYLPLNPDRINAHVSFDPASILAHGFAGGGTFALTAPQIAFAAQAGATVLPLDFFSTAGFADYNLVSYKTALLPNQFEGNLGGTNAVLATQTLTIGAGQVLNLTQSMLPTLLGNRQSAALSALETDGDIYTIVSPSVPTDAWDRKAASLSLGGLLELHVARGGRIEGDAGAHLTVAKLFNEGTIHLPGGTITQSEVLPLIYGGDGLRHGVTDLGQAFSSNAAGRFTTDGLNKLGVTNEDGELLTNSELAGSHGIYLLGMLGEGEGVRLANGSVTDLSGTVVLNPRGAFGGDGKMIRDGRVVAGGTLRSLPSHVLAGLPFRANDGLLSEFNLDNGQRYGLVRSESLITLDRGSLLDISGASGKLDRLAAYVGGLDARGYTLTSVWSDGGTLSAPNGLIMAGATVNAEGGAPQAQGGKLELSDLVLVERDSGRPVENTVSASQIEASGFDTLRVFGSLTGKGDVSLSLDRGFFLESKPFALDPRFDLTDASVRDGFVPTIRSDGGSLLIEAGYVRFGSGLFDTISNPAVGEAGSGQVTFKAQSIDVVGALLLDRSVGSARFEAVEDLRLIGARPWQALLPSNAAIPTTLQGHIAANGNLTFAAARVYPTTGSDFTITSTASNGRISFERNGTGTAPVPLSAGGSLTVQAATIIQGGALYAPLGDINLGGNNPIEVEDEETGETVFFAPATASVVLRAGSLTSITAGGQAIPYGTTTDGTEWFFAPTSADPLTAPPGGTLHIAGASIDLATGATIDLSGGGDVFAYEFVPGTGGSYDVLSRLNNDASTGNNGLQYPDGRQVYAIVPGLSDASVAAFDPIYSADYGRDGDINSVDGVGKRVWLDGAPGLAAGWYTLLPARYALLPGGMRVVERTEATAVLPRTGIQSPDGTLYVSGHYGDAASGSSESTLRLFDVMPRETVLAHSRIELTSGNEYFGDQAARDGRTSPRLGVDAGRLVLDPTSRLIVEAAVKANAATGGRAAQIDIGGSTIEIVSTRPSGGGNDGVVRLTAGSLTNLNAGSLLIGGIRTDNADGTTAIDVVASRITVSNDAAHSLTAAEIVMVVDGEDSALTVANGASIVATGTLADTRTGAYVIRADEASGDTGAGAVLRVANGVERLVTRLTEDGLPLGPGPVLNVGNATLSGRSVLIDSTGDLTLAGSAAVTADYLAIGAGEVTFTSRPAGVDGLVVTPQLRQRFAGAQRLTIRSTNGMAFDNGLYDLGNIRLDTPALTAREGGTVTINADSLTLSNETGTVLGACGTAGSAACGSAELSVAASEITVGPGTIRTLGFEAGGVALTATKGLFGTGTGKLDVGSADLDVTTPFIGDRAVTRDPGAPVVISRLTLASAGDVRIVAPAGTQPAAPTGTPGSNLEIQGDTISVSGTTLRATAGLISLKAQDGITLSNGAVISAPGYDKSFGDAVDSTTASAAAGKVSLLTQAGDINLGAGTLVSVGGGAGNAGSLVLSAAEGTVHFNGTLDGKGRTGGGSFSLDTRGAFDLALLGASANAQGFTRALDIRTRTGDLTLAAGQRLVAENVSLTADGGMLTVAGTIDVSGVQGGDVALYGLDGVTIASTGLIDASADGYADGDSRQASGGDVTLGTIGTGTISIARGAVIDLSAKRPGDRLVAFERNGQTFHQVVAGDAGGTLSFRAPLLEQDTGDTVSVSVDSAQSILGAREITLEGFKRWDLGEIADSGDYKGVTRDEETGAIVLDVSEDLDTAKPDGTMTTVGGVNFLGDNAPGTVVDFVQNFDLSAVYASLGGVAELDSFRARPGVELAHDGDITLASNWNLGAGVVNVTAAIAGSVMRSLGGGASAVVDGAEADVFGQYTRMIYRTNGGDILGEAPVVALRAGGNLRLEGSLTDGFFQFSGPIEIATGGGGDDEAEPFQFAFQRLGGLESLGLYYYAYGFNALANGAPYTILGGGGGGGGGSTSGTGYSSFANSPAALSPVDTAATMVPFPEIGGGMVQVSTASYRLVAGSALSSANPVAVRRAGVGTITFSPYKAFEGVEGSVPQGPITIDLYFDVGENDLFLGSEFPDENSHFVKASELAEALGEDSIIEIDLAWDPSDPQSGVNSQVAWDRFIEALDSGSDEGLAALVDQYGYPDIYDNGYLSGAAAVLQYWLVNYMEPAVAADLPAYFEAFGLPNPFGSTGGGGGGGEVEPGFARNVVRTGTGSITVTAAQDVNLYDPASPLPTYTVSGTTYGEGATAIYTIGRLADATSFTLPDPVTGRQVSIDVPSLAPANGAYYLTDGGDIRVSAGGDVRSLRPEGPKADRDYLIGQVGSTTTLRVAINATAGDEIVNGFGEGIGALGGGDVSVSAGGSIVDLTVVSAGSAATASTTTESGKALVTFGGGDVALDAGADVLGGRFDIWSGQGSIRAGGDIRSAGTVLAPNTSGVVTSTSNGLTIRLFDATVDASSVGAIYLQGIASVTSSGPNAQGAYLQANVDSYGFYAERARVGLTANDSLVFTNTAASVLVSDIQEIATFNTVWPASVEAVSLLGDIDLAGGAGATLMMPGAQGDLSLLAGGAIRAATLAMLDADPGQLPGLFSNFAMQGGVLGSGLAYRFPAVFSSTSDSERTQQHNGSITHAGDDQPVRIYAGTDIGDHEGGLILSVAEQARIGAGRDIVNMMFFGQNIAGTDITRIVAGRDITATTTLVSPASGFDGPELVVTEPRPAVLGNTFVIGGPGSLMIEAGRDIGPFLNSAETLAIRYIGNAQLGAGTEVYGGGILSVGNEWNPGLGDQGADISVMFGVARGADFDGLRDYYVDPANLGVTDPDDAKYLPDYLFETVNGSVDRSKPVYGTMLVAWMKAQAPQALTDAYGRTEVSYEEAYAVFKTLPALRQRRFLTQVYFNELQQFADPDSTTNNQSARGYFAVNRLFPGSLGYTLNGESENDFEAVRSVLEAQGYGEDSLAEGLGFLAAQGYDVTVGGADFTAHLVDGSFVPVVDGVEVSQSEAERAAFNSRVTDALLAGSSLDFITAEAQTGNLDLRLATIQTARGGDISILGPGGRVIAGSTVRTSEQAERRAYDGGRLFAGNADGSNALAPYAGVITGIPTGYEGVLTLRGGSISTFTDGDFLLNQSRLYSRDGGDITMWSSNGDLNAGQGPKTTANVPPVVVKVNQDLFTEEDQAGSTSGAGIAAYPPSDANAAEPNIYLMAPRGTVDAGDAGVRVAGGIFVAALRVLNADNFQVAGPAVGISNVPTADVGGVASASAAAAAASQAADASDRPAQETGGNLPSIITVEVLGYGGGDCPNGYEPDGTCH